MWARGGPNALSNPPPAPYSLMSSSATGQKLLQVKHESRRRRRRRGGGLAPKKLGVCWGGVNCQLLCSGAERAKRAENLPSSSHPHHSPDAAFFSEALQTFFFFCAPLSSQSRCVSTSSPSKVLAPGLHWYTNDALKINLAPIHRVGEWPQSRAGVFVVRRGRTSRAQAVLSLLSPGDSVSSEAAFSVTHWKWNALFLMDKKKKEKEKVLWDEVRGLVKKTKKQTKLSAYKCCFEAGELKKYIYHLSSDTNTAS